MFELSYLKSETRNEILTNNRISHATNVKLSSQNYHYLRGVHACNMVKREGLGLRAGVQPESRGWEHR